MATTSKLPRIVGESLYYERLAPHRFRLTEPVEVTLSNGDFLYIPADYVTDFASVPRIFWGIVMPVGRHNLAVLVHDFLIDSGCDRAAADRELLHFLQLSHVHPVKARLMYCLVRAYATIKPSLTKLKCLI